MLTCLSVKEFNNASFTHNPDRFLINTVSGELSIFKLIGGRPLKILRTGTYQFMQYDICPWPRRLEGI